ncbi:MAG: CotH kinase family protein, partial [Myxococcota bacterium]|nr:CotH kinase family protein [Myxococcota bacterium]
MTGKHTLFWAVVCVMMAACGTSTTDVDSANGDVITSEDASAAGDDGVPVDGSAEDVDGPPEADTPGIDDGASVAADAPVDDTPPPDTQPYFDLDHVLDVDIEMAPEDWESLRLETRTIADILGGDCLHGPPDQIFSWFPATVTVDGVTVSGAGVRKKGYLGSMSDEKPSLKVRFDKFGEELLDGVLQRLTLNNVQQDTSKLNTCMSYHVFASAGAPTPRCNFATVTVNGTDLGLFVHVESIKKEFVARHFDDAEGNLYEGTLSDFRPVWKNTFDKKSNTSEADWSDIDAVADALSDESPAGLETLTELVDVDRFLTHWALEVLVGHWDGYAGNRNNFYLYREPDGPFVFIPWGPDSSFNPINHPFQDITDPQSVLAHSGLANRFYRDDAIRAAYVARMVELLDTVWDEEALNTTVDQMAQVIGTYTTGEERSAAGWDTQRVRNFVNGRRAAVLADLQPTPAAWPWSLNPPDICWEILGAVDITFEATWGTQGTDDFMDVGSAQVASYV